MFFKSFFSLIKTCLLPYKFFVYGFNVLNDLDALEKVYEMVVSCVDKTNMLEEDIVIFNKLKRAAISKTTQLDRTVQRWFPNFEINSRYRHNALYDVYLTILCHLGEFREQEAKIMKVPKKVELEPYLQMEGIL